MAQKTNPISLRLRINRRFDSFWYSSFFYSDLFGRDLKVRKHFQKLFRQSKKRSLARVGYTGNAKEQKVFLYWARPSKAERKNKPSFWRRRRNLQKAQIQSSTYSFPTQGNPILQPSSLDKLNNPELKKKARLLRLFGIFFSSTLIDPRSKKEIYTKILEILSQQNSLSPKGFSDTDLQNAFKEAKRIKFQNQLTERNSRNRNKNKSNLKKIHSEGDLKTLRENLVRSIHSSFENKIEKNLRQNFKIQSSVVPSILKTPYLSAEGITELIKAELKKRVFFKRIFGSIKQETQSLLKGGHIKGIRILISGRLGRQEKAKKASLYIGRTSLNTFNQKIDYSSSSALTRYGQIGIKVWISF